MLTGRRPFDTIYLCTEFVDFRKQISGLSIYVEAVLDLNPFDPSLFIFCNKRRSHLKALYYDKNGFAMWQKALVKDKFKWPKHHTEATLTVSDDTLLWLLDGLDISKMKPHASLHFESVF